jgi:di/tricarboxylate transporter
MAFLSLVFLLVAVIVGFTKKMNVGFIAMGLSLVIGRIGGVSDSAIISGFSSSTFVSLLGITFWFAIINQTGVVDLLAKKAVAKSSKTSWLIPFIMMFLGFIVSYMGPGAVPATVTVVLSIPLAFEMGVNPMLYALPPFAGLCAGRISQFTPEGAWLAELGIEQGYGTGLVPYVTVNGIIIAFACTLVVFIFYKGWKKPTLEYTSADLPKFNKEQTICLLSIVTMIIMVVGFKINTALACLLIGVVLLVLGIGTEKETIRTMPWGTMVLVSGVGLLMGVVNALGGITLLSDTLAKIMTPKSAASVLAITGGMMSWFSSSFGVVFPTLMPTVPGIVESFGGSIGGAPLISAIAFGASIAGISPFSSGGSMAISAMSVDKRFDESETNKVFIQLFVWAGVFLATTGILGFLGIFEALATIMM